MQRKTNEMQRQRKWNARQRDGMEGKIDAQFAAYLSPTEDHVLRNLGLGGGGRAT